MLTISPLSALCCTPLDGQGKADAENGAIVSMRPGPRSKPGNNCTFNATLLEAVIASDPITADPLVSYPHHGYSPSGDVTAPVIYANFGQESDFIAVSSR